MKRSLWLLSLLSLASAAYCQAIPLQQSTASQAVKFGPFVDSTDGNTEETALTIANTDIKCSKNGGALASKNSGGGTHDANGWYTVTFDATDTNTAGRLQCYVHVSGALPVFREFMVLPTANYAALYSTAPGAANGLFIAGTNAATTITTALTTTFTGNVTGSVGSVTGAVGSVTGNVGGNVTGSVGSVATGGLTNASFACTGGSFLILGVVDCGTAQSASSTGAVLRSAAALGDDAANGMTLLMNGSTQGYAQARAFTDYTGSTDTGVVDTWSVTPSGTLTYYLFGTAPVSGSGSGLDAAGVRAAVGLASANLDTQLSTIDDYVDTEVAAIKTKTDFLPSATAGATGGLFIAGTNAATTITTGFTTTFTGNLTGNVGGNVTGSVGSVATGGITASSIATDAIGAAEVAADASTEIAAAVVAAQGTITGTCDSGSTTTCVDNALTQADATQLEDRLICFDDSWCGLITTFTPASDTVTTTKTAPSTRASKAYTIFPSTLQ